MKANRPVRPGRNHAIETDGQTGPDCRHYGARHLCRCIVGNRVVGEGHMSFGNRSGMIAVPRARLRRLASASGRLRGCWFAAAAAAGLHFFVREVAAAPHTAMHIAIVGSSTAAGTGASDYSHSWAGLYASHLASLNPSNQVVNLAVGGYTTFHTLPTGTINRAGRPPVDPAHNITAALAVHPDAVIINLPSNDAARGFSESETETNFLIMAAACTASNVPVWIATTQPRNLSAAGATNLRDVRAWIIATFPNHYLDFWTTLANADGTIAAAYGFGDGIHLNNAGHAVLELRVVSSRLDEVAARP